MNKSIKSKIMIMTGGLIFLILIIQTVFNIFFSKPFYVSQKKHVIEKTFQTIKTDYSDSNSFYEYLTGISEAANLQIVIFNSQETLYDSKSHVSFIFGDAPRDGIRKNDYNQSFKNDRNFSEAPEISYKKTKDEIFERISIKGKFTIDEDTIYVLIDSPIPAIKESIQVLTQVGAYISLFVLVLGLLFAWFFSNRLSKPIKEIDCVAKGIANLDFEYRADENIKTKEFHDLAVSINKMSDALKSSIDKLQEDILQQKRIDKMRIEFIANVSHELKTPLCLLLMYSENLKNNVTNIDKDYYCDVIIDETNRLNDMVLRLLQISKIENGLTKMNSVVIDFSELTDNVSKKINILATNKNIKFQINIAPGIFVFGDSEYLEQAIKNYITNAIGHTDDGGSISITLLKKNNLARFCVFNTGKNINDEDIEFLWESFYKTDKARVRDEDNHIGLGLYIVKTIINAHRGAYGVVNREDGVEFWFDIPIQNQ